MTLAEAVELKRLMQESVRPVGHSDFCSCGNCGKANQASAELVEKLDPALPELLDLAITQLQGRRN